MYEKFANIDGIRFETNGELTACKIKNSNCTAEIYPHGAHITRFQPDGQLPMLFLSNQAIFQNAKAIRGGVPICFPWFGNHAEDPNAPAHGLVRQKIWELDNIDQQAKQTTLTLSTNTEHFSVRFTVIFGIDLQMIMQVTNTADRTMSFQTALHTYFQIADISAIEINGLQSTKFLDQLTSLWHEPTYTPIRFSKETDRIYQLSSQQPTRDDITIKCTKSNKQIKISHTNARSVVVWNPWIDKAKRLADFGDDQWQEMCCVECGNIGDNCINLAAGLSHTMTVRHGYV